MIALALFYSIIIGLLFLLVILLKNYFEDYYTMQQLDSKADYHCSIKQKERESFVDEEEINTMIKELVMEIEQKFQSIHLDKDTPKTTEILSERLKNVLISHVNLLKIKPQNTCL